MNFIESIRTCITKFADFKGCASRSEYWWWTLFTVIASISLGIVSDKLEAAFTVATLLPSIAVGARRLHATDRSGWLQLLWLVPILGWGLLIYWLVQKETSTNRYSS
ncbi:MAG: DUF805 domain-containing protein [Rhodoferax sp.]|nr:DUF805 domain-containing protein [Rhodoferax sp.]